MIAYSPTMTAAQNGPRNDQQVQSPWESPGAVTLIGSGEMSASMGKVHRAVMSRIAGPVRAVFLDTPAGFELNADQISDRAVTYFKEHLNLDLVVASFKAADAATPTELDTALRKLRRANYIFAGPGSPTYAVRNWEKTAVLEAMVRRLATGAHLVLASAAAIAMGRYALPVYEIYKVGEAPHWVNGLDLLGPYGLELAIVSHWNNAEGGTHDTRYCFMGEPRMRLLEQTLPDTTTILGIDEYTACIVDLGNDKCRVMGAGQVTIRRRGRETTHPAGIVFDLGQLQEVPPAGAPYTSLQPSAPAEAPMGAHEPSEEPAAHRNGWPETWGADEADLDSFIDLLVWVRAQLRAANEWTLADEIRRRLSELGIILEDGRTETTWRRA